MLLASLSESLASIKFYCPSCTKEWRNARRRRLWLAFYATSCDCLSKSAAYYEFVKDKNECRFVKINVFSRSLMKKDVCLIESIFYGRLRAVVIFLWDSGGKRAICDCEPASGEATSPSFPAVCKIYKFWGTSPANSNSVNSNSQVIWTQTHSPWRAFSAIYYYIG